MVWFFSTRSTSKLPNLTYAVNLSHTVESLQNGHHWCKTSVCLIEMSALYRFFLRQFDHKAKQSASHHTVHLMKVSALQCVCFIEIPLYCITIFLISSECNKARIVCDRYDQITEGRDTGIVVHALDVSRTNTFFHKLCFTQILLCF